MIRQTRNINIKEDLPLLEKKEAFLINALGPEVKERFPFDAELTERFRRAQKEEVTTSSSMEILPHRHRMLSAQVASAHALDEQEVGDLLCATTSGCIDNIVDANGAYVLFKRAISDGRLPELLEAVQKGPDNGALIWTQPKNEIEFLASLVRHSIRSSGKIRIRSDENVYRWIGEALSEGGCATHPRLGGATAVATHLGLVLGVKTAMFRIGDVPGELVGEIGEAKLPGDTVIRTQDGKKTKLQDFPVREKSFGHINLDLNPSSFPKELREVYIGDKLYSTEKVYSDDVLGTTRHKRARGFGTASHEVMEGFGQQHDHLILSGFQHLQYFAPGQEVEPKYSGDTPERFIDALRSFKSAKNSPITLLYSDPQNFNAACDAFSQAKEGKIFDLVCGRPEEFARLLEQIADQDSYDLIAPSDRNRIVKLFSDSTLRNDLRDEFPGSSLYDHPHFMIEGGEYIRKSLGIPTLRLRARYVDCIVRSASSGATLEDCIAVENAQLTSRCLGALKAASKTGLLTKRTFVENSPSQKSVEMWKICCNALSLSGFQRIEDTYSWISGDTIISVTPVQELWDKTGGTVSTGDVMDTSFALLAHDWLASR